MQQSVGPSTERRIENELKVLESRKKGLEKDEQEIQERIEERHKKKDDVAPASGAGRLPGESRREYLLRTGKITPFSAVSTGFMDRPPDNLHDALAEAEDEHDDEEHERVQDLPHASHRHLVRPDLAFDEISGGHRTDTSESVGKGKRRKLETRPPRPPTSEALAASAAEDDSSSSYVASEDAQAVSEDEEGHMPNTLPATKPTGKRKKGKTEDGLVDLRGLDDGNESVYQKRLEKWVSSRSAARRRVLKAGTASDESDADEEWFQPHPTKADLELGNGLRVPGDISAFLFPYQQTGTQWLWELHQKEIGGIIADEMGLGKTVQAIAYLASLHHSKKYSKPAIVVCPATVMRQWVSEFHRWWPPFRVSILHASGSGMINLRKETTREDALTSEMMGESYNSRHLSAGQKAAKRIIKRVTQEGHVLVTTYSGLQTYADALVDIEWGCAILDEGHKIRNPDAGITFSCKELRTPHRIILSGTPMQNSLVDLWSLFDFVYPMLLGDLVTFKNQFENPIRQGGYASATNLQVQIATKCAETLKNAISPYLLQRFKADVATDLPNKSEQIIFCRLTLWQRNVYKRFLDSDDMKAIERGKLNSLFGIDILRKICNHPDLVDRAVRSHESNYGNAERSGKMMVLKGLLEVWRDTGHKTLLFSQTRQMLDIIEKFIRSLGSFKYRRMDGTTAIKERQTVVDTFNRDPDIHVFLLTTKVGGIGVNLTGADRVIVFDPDWNPSTDMQARERAWRLGQKREVTIFRLMTKGTIEEKIYHRQVYKQYLTNKITRDPKARENFDPGDLYDLFSLSDEHEKEFETTKLFRNAQMTYQEGSNNEVSDTPGPESKPKSSTAPGNNENISQVHGVASVEKDIINDSSDTSDDKPSEERIMQTIFARSGVHSALEHDETANGKRKVRADPKMIEAEARRVANEAAEELRKASEVARTVPIGLPTWTGTFGVAGRADRGRSSARPSAAGPSSASLVASLNPRAAMKTEDSGTLPTRMPRGKDFIVLIRDFIASRRGPVYTQTLIDHFNPYCTNEQRCAEFGEMLKMVAQMKRAPDGRGKWTLKPEFARAAREAERR